MSRTARLLDLMQLFHQNRYPISAQHLAKKLNISIRTVYRDIDTLRNQGVDIVGEAGIGYVLNDSFMLPPLMFTVQEIEALVLGSRWVKAYGDTDLITSANQAIAKINRVMPKVHQANINSNTLFVQQYSDCQDTRKLQAHAPTIRQAIRLQRQCIIDYTDEKSATTQRIIYPFGLAFFGTVQLVMAWCCLRQDFRHFRVDRLTAVTLLDKSYSPNKQQLLKCWQQQQDIDLFQN